MANPKQYQNLSIQPSGSMTKMRAEQIKSEDGLGSLAIDLEALRGQVKDIIGADDYKEEITGEYAKVQIVDLAAHLDASSANSSLSVKQAANVVGAFSVNTDKLTVAAATGNTMVAGTFNAVGAADLDSTLDVAGASDLHGAVKAYSTFNAVGAADLDSTLNVDGASDLRGAVYAHSTFRADGAVDINAAMDVSGSSDLHGAVHAYSTLEVDGESTLASAIIEDITAQHIMFAGAAHEVEGSANLKWDGTDLIVGSAKVSDLTATRVTFAGASGSLVDDAKMTFAAGVLTVSGSTYSANASIVGNLTVAGNFVVEGDTVTQNVGTVTTEDSIITLNKGASSIPLDGVGIEFESGSAIVGYVKTDGAGNMMIKAATGSELTLDVNAAKTIAVAGDLTIEAASFVNQDLTTDAMPQFTKAKLTDLTASRLMASNGSKETVSADLSAWVAGTTNQVNVADNASGSITLSLPQDIHSGATPSFVNVKHSGLVGEEGKAMKIAASGTIAPAAWNEFIEVQANVGLFLSQSALKAQVQLAQDIRTTASPTFAGAFFGTYGSVSLNAGTDLKITASTGSLKFDDSYRAAGGWTSPLKLAGAAGEWTALETAYGSDTLSLLAMLTAAAPSTNKRYVWTSSSATGTDVVLSAIDAVTFPIGAASYQNGKSDVFVNGQLMAEGSGKDFEFAAPSGTDRVKIVFAFSLQSGDVVTLHRYPAA